MITVDSQSRLVPGTDSFRDVLETASDKRGRPLEVTVVEIQPLVTSGSIVACDGLLLEAPPLVLSLPSGAYSVHLAVAHVGDDDQRVAFARVCVAADVAIRWTPCRYQGTDDRFSSESGGIHGYPVETGTGAFGDENAAHDILAELAARPTLGDDILAMMRQAYQPTREWVQIRTPHGSVVTFSSGYGDGFYSTYAGFDSADRLTALVTDFGVFRWAPHLTSPA